MSGHDDSQHVAVRSLGFRLADSTPVFPRHSHAVRDSPRCRTETRNCLHEVCRVRVSASVSRPWGKSSLGQTSMEIRHVGDYDCTVASRVPSCIECVDLSGLIIDITAFLIVSRLFFSLPLRRRREQRRPPGRFLQPCRSLAATSSRTQACGSGERLEGDEVLGGQDTLAGGGAEGEEEGTQAMEGGRWVAGSEAGKYWER